MISLVLEASTYEGSVALLDGDRVLGERSVAMRGREHEALMSAVGEVLVSSSIAASRIGRVVCGAGPGSFTSLRIAGAIAKGLAASTGAALVPVSSLALLAASARPMLAGRYLAVADAMRGESYVQEFDRAADGSVTCNATHHVIASLLVDQWAADRGAIAVGPTRSGAGQAVPVASATGRSRHNEKILARSVSTMMTWRRASSTRSAPRVPAPGSAAPRRGH